MLEWRTVPNYEQQYEASRDGLIKRIGSALPLVQVPRKKDGRLIVNLCKDGVMKQRLVHQVITETFHGPRPDGHDACHWDGDNQHNSADNLYWGTKGQNFADSLRHGTNKEIRKTQCPRGHLLKVPNLRTKKGTYVDQRDCLACGRASALLSARGVIRPRSSFGFEELADSYYIQIMAGH